MEELTLFYSVLTVAAVLLLAYWCSRMLARQWLKSSASGSLQILEQLQVGQDRRILLLKIGEKNYLIGVSQAGIQLLTEVEGEFEARMAPAVPETFSPPFRDFVRRYLEKVEARENDRKGGDR